MARTRGFTISGVPMVDPKGRWVLLHATGERPLGAMRLEIGSLPYGDGGIFTRERAQLGTSQMTLVFHVTDAGGTKRGRMVRDRNLAALHNALMIGRPTTVGVDVDGVRVFQRGIVTASSSGVETGEGLLKVTFLLTLIGGYWEGEAAVEVVGETVPCLSGGTAPARPMWMCEGPVTSLQVEQGDTMRTLWSGNVPQGHRLIISGWKSWMHPLGVQEWWLPPSSGASTTQVGENEALLPDVDGEYLVAARVNGRKVTDPNTPRLYARCGIHYL